MANTATLKGIQFGTGDKVKVYQKIQEAGKTRVQPFEGVVLAISGGGENKMFTVRKISAGNIGVERIWPMSSPWLEKIEVIRKGKVRRAKIFYVRQPQAKLKFQDEVKKTAIRKPRRRISRKKT